MPLPALSPVTRRLMPLYIGTFLQSVVFWYAIEKLFMFSIGFDNFTVGIMVAVMSVVMLAVETPSGVLADRWSRKGVAIIATVMLALAALIGAASYSVPMYILSTVFWGIYAALYSGTYDSMIYDTDLEEHGNSEQYAKYLGRLRAIEGAAFVIGALTASVISQHLGMRETFIISLPIILCAIPLLAMFREPKLHKAEVAEPVFRHIRLTFGAVLQNRFLLLIVIATVGFAALQEAYLELSQLWFISLSTPVVLFGIIGAVIFSTWTIGGLIAPYIKSRIPEAIALIVTMAGTGVIIISRNYWLTLTAMFVVLSAVVAIGVVLSRIMHDELPSKLRAGSASVVSTLARLTLIPSVLLFTTIANNQNVFTATYVLLATCAVAVGAFVIHGFNTRRA